MSLSNKCHLFNSLGENAELPEQLVDVWGVLGGHLLDVPAHLCHHPQYKKGVKKNSFHSFRLLLSLACAAWVVMGGH